MLDLKYQGLVVLLQSHQLAFEGFRVPSEVVSEGVGPLDLQEELFPFGLDGLELAELPVDLFQFFLHALDEVLQTLVVFPLPFIFFLLFFQAFLHRSAVLLLFQHGLLDGVHFLLRCLFFVLFVLRCSDFPHQFFVLLLEFLDVGGLQGLFFVIFL